MKITRSFQQVKQLRQYEPITVFAQYEEAVDVKDAKKVSRKLHKLAVQDVNEAMQAIFKPKKKD